MEKIINGLFKHRLIPVISALYYFIPELSLMLKINLTGISVVKLWHYS